MSKSEEKKLTTLAKYNRLTPYLQGYVVYVEAAWPGSELVREVNPYSQGTRQWKKWEEGNHQAMLDVMDGEE
jgi:hypothetical protein